MSKYVYVYDDFRNPDNSVGVTSITQINKIVRISERVLARKLKECNTYADPSGRFKIMRIPFERDDRRKNGSRDRLLRNN